MKTRKTSLFLIALMACACLWSQNRSRTVKNEDSKEVKEDNQVVKEVDKINKASEEINATAETTNAAIKSTVANTKETLDAVGSLFGTGKKKKNKTAGAVTITIQQVEYDNDYLTRLYEHVSKYRGVKNPAKNFSNGQASIKATYKESADALWQGVPKEIRKGFKMIQMDDQSISLQYVNTQFEEN